MPHRPPVHKPAGHVPRPPKPGANAKGYTYRWQQRRLVFLRDHPLCAACEREGRLTPATVVDHVIPHRGDKELFWDESNWAALCVPHHNSKSAGERLTR